MPDAAGTDDVAVERRLPGVGMEGQQAGRGRHLDTGHSAGRRDLEQDRSHERPVTREGLAPAASTLSFRQAPDELRAVDRGRSPTEPDLAPDPERRGHRCVGTGAGGAEPCDRRSSAQTRATASSSPASAGATRPLTRTSRSRYSRSIVPRSRTRARSSPAVYGSARSTSIQSEARTAAVSARSVSMPYPVSADTKTAPAMDGAG